MATITSTCRVVVSSQANMYRGHHGTVDSVSGNIVYVRLDGHRARHVLPFDSTDLTPRQDPSPLDYLEPSTHDFARLDADVNLITSCGCPGEYGYFAPITTTDWVWIDNSDHTWMDGSLAEFII